MKHRKKIMAGILAAAVLAAALTACNTGEGGTKVVFTTGFGRDEVFPHWGGILLKGGAYVYLANTQNQMKRCMDHRCGRLSGTALLWKKR